MQEECTEAAGAGRMVKETMERWHRMEGTENTTAQSSTSTAIMLLERKTFMS